MFINYTKSNIEEMLVSCTGNQINTNISRTEFYENINIKNRNIHKDLNNNVLGWEKYFRRLRANIPSVKDFIIKNSTIIVVF